MLFVLESYINNNISINNEGPTTTQIANIIKMTDY